MRIISAYVTNFCSYKSLNFNFIDQNLTLIQGSTGSGKSTLCDITPWCLFGKTAKNGAVDEVLQWPGTGITTGKLHLETDSKALIVSRSRGPKPKDNDLYYMEIGGSIVRGKDLNDTQKLLNNVIGIDLDLYLAGAYFHEFSQTAQFFTTTAKNRRQICEQIVDLSLAKTLDAKLKEELKITKTKLLGTELKLSNLMGQNELLERMAVNQAQKARQWDSAYRERVRDLETKLTRFGTAMPHNPLTCPTCRQPVKSTVVIKPQINPYIEQLERLLEERNPYSGPINDNSNEISENKVATTALNSTLSILKSHLLDLETLQEVTQTYRTISISNAITYIESQTNQLLSDYFDAEIKVTFSAEDGDKLEVSLLKDGNTCVYTQLSKGQRCILKLAFGVSIMKAVQNHQGITLNQLFFDEALDGCDEIMKTKGLKLLESLSLTHESVFLVEHSETIKAMANNSYQVSLINGNSVIAKTQ